MSINKPSTKLEDWRYADSTALDSLAPEAFAEWKEIAIPQHSTQTHSMLVGSGAPELHRIRLDIGKHARAELLAVITGSDYTRVEIEVNCAEGAHFAFGGVTIGGGAAVREFVTRVNHDAPGASSHQVIRSVHWGEATGNFLGRIEVGRGGQQTDAEQDFKGLVLEKGASANAKPELEIFADDVKCAHGAAIGQLDEAARYYMASRGIAPEAAKKLLVRAFIGDALTAAGEPEEQERLLEAALAALEGADL